MICYLKITGASDASLNTCTSMGKEEDLIPWEEARKKLSSKAKT